MPMDPNRKTLRHFYCSDGLWQMFEQMSENLDRGVDELVNDAMRAYAEQGGDWPARTPTRSRPGSTCRMHRDRERFRRPCRPRA